MIVDNEEGVKIKLGDLDNSIKVEIARTIYMGLSKMFGSVLVSDEEFINCLESGVREELYSKVKQHYSFLKGVNVVITDEEFYSLHELMN